MAGILMALRTSNTHEQKQLAFRLRARGWRLVDIAREVGCTAPMVGLMVREGRFTTGVPDLWQPRPSCLTIGEREEILVGIRAGDSLTAIARRLGRAPSTVSREVAANGGRGDYSAWTGHQRAQFQARRPGASSCKSFDQGPLRDEVASTTGSLVALRELWSFADEILEPPDRWTFPTPTIRRCAG